MIKRIALFYGFAFVLTILLAVIQEATGIGVGTLILPQWGPGLAALLMLLVFRKDGVKLTLTVRRDQFGKYAAALLLPLLVAAIILLLASGLTSRPNLLAVAGLPSLFALGGMLIGALGEELGWRGYLQPIVERRRVSIVSAIPVGVLWALWHMGLYQNGLLYMLLLVVLLVTYSLVIYSLTEGTRYNLLVAVLFHFSINVGNFWFADLLTDTGLLTINAAVWIGVALIVLSRRYLLHRSAASLLQKRIRLPLTADPRRLPMP